MASSSEAALHRRDSEQGPRREPPLRLGPHVRPAIWQHEQYIIARIGQSRRRFRNTVSDDARPVSAHLAILSMSGVGNCGVGATYGRRNRRSPCRTFLSRDATRVQTLPRQPDRRAQRRRKRNGWSVQCGQANLGTFQDLQKVVVHKEGLCVLCATLCAHSLLKFQISFDRTRGLSSVTTAIPQHRLKLQLHSESLNRVHHS